MNLLDHLQDTNPAWILLVTAALALAVIPLLRWLLPPGQRHRGGAAILFLGMSVVLSACALAVGGMVGTSPASLLQVMSLLALVIGLISLVGLVVVDLVLARLGVHIPPILRDLLHVTVTVAIVMALLRLEGLDLFSLVTTSAVLTAVIGLALQSTIANVFGGLALQLDRTLGRGEWIEVGKRVGRILEIGWRSTRIVTKDGDTVFVPNSELVSGEVLNFSHPTGAHRVTVRIGFHYRHSPNEVRRVLLPAVGDSPGVLGQPAPECGPADFGDSAVVYALRYWISDFGHEIDINEEVRTRLWYAARRAGLEIPYPIRTLVPGSSVLAVPAQAEGSEHDDRLRVLAGSDLLAALSDADRERVAAGMRRVEYGAGERIVAEEPGDALYLVHSGEVTVGLTSNGSDHEGVTVRTGDVFEARSPRGPGGSTLCRACSDVSLYRLDREDLIARSPEVAARLAAIVADRQALLEAQRGSTTPASERAAGLLPRVQGFFRQS